jgi:hypothetical protein
MADKVKFITESKFDGRQKITVLIVKPSGERIMYDYIMRDTIWIKPSWRKHFTFDDLRDIQSRMLTVRRYFVQSKPTEEES